MPKLHLITFAAAPLRQSAIGGPLREQPYGGLIQFAVILFQTDHQIPADLRGQLKDQCLRVKSVQQKDVEKTAAVPVRQIAEQTQGGGVLPLAGPQPFQGKKGLDGTVDNLASHGAVIVLDLFDSDPGFADRDTAFQTGVAVAAVAGEHFNTIESGHDAALHAVGIEDFVPLQCPVDVGELLQLILQLVVVLDPAADFVHFLLGNDAAGGAAGAESDG